MKLSFNMRVVDPDGVPIEKDKSARIDETLSARDNNWVPRFLETLTVPRSRPAAVITCM